MILTVTEEALWVLESESGVSIELVFFNSEVEELVALVEDAELTEVEELLVFFTVLAFGLTIFKF